MKKIGMGLIALSMMSVANATVFTVWDFNTPSLGYNADKTVAGWNDVQQASFGSGQVTSTDPVTAAKPQYKTDQVTSDPILTGSLGKDLHGANYSATTPFWGNDTLNQVFALNMSSNSLANDKKIGLQGLASTAGWTNVVVSWDQRFTGSAWKNEMFQYTIDGGANWVDFQSKTFTAAGWYSNNAAGAGAADIADVVGGRQSVDLTGVNGVSNNPNFGFRIVGLQSNGALNLAGTWRFDYVTVAGVPEPSSIVVLALGAVGIARRRRNS